LGLLAASAWSNASALANSAHKVFFPEITSLDEPIGAEPALTTVAAI
jgi:hypothetical protein